MVKMSGISLRVLVLTASATMLVAARGPYPHIIVAQGDSLTYGSDFTSSGIASPLNGSMLHRSSSPYPETLAHLLGARYQVINYGFPGDRTSDGLKRWVARKGTSVVLLMYGTNDCLNYGGYADGPLSAAMFSQNLRQIIANWRSVGARVVLIMPPPLQDRGSDAKLEACRSVVRNVARNSHAKLVLPPKTVSWTDGVHLSASSYRALATKLAPVTRRLAE